MTDTSRSRANWKGACIIHILRMKWLFKQPRPKIKVPHVRRLNTRLARDIGLSDAELERHHFKWPSQSTHHPRG